MPLKSCFIPTCGNTSANSSKLFLMVPRDSRRSKWFLQINKSNNSTTVYYCCEDHFNLPEDAENWIRFKEFGSKFFLKKDVVPHLCLSTKKEDIKAQVTSSSKKRKQANLYQFNLMKSSYRRQLFPEVNSEEIESPKSKKFREHTELISSPSGTFLVAEVKYIDKGVQTDDWRVIHRTNVATNTDVEFKVPIKIKKKTISLISHESSSSSNSSSKTTDSETEYNTEGTYSQTSLESILLPSSSKSKVEAYKTIENNSKFYTGLPKETYFIIKLLCNDTTKLTKLDVLLTLKKIRLNDQYERLADDFKISVSKTGQIFRNSVPIMSSCLKQIIYWPKSEDIKKRLPVTFWYRYNNVESIIDCFEIEIQKPSDPVKQSYTWSDCKKCNTVKYLISATPYGLINFCSTGFGGRTSDKLLFENSGYLNILKSNTDVMADRGFKHIAALLSQKNCHLIRPPSVTATEKLTKAQVKESKRIASLRIHIERVIGRIREFSMLSPHALINSNYMN